MKRVVMKYSNSKFSRFINGLLFAAISFSSLAYCTMNISNNSNIQINIVLSFVFAIISMLLGFFTMFRGYGVTKELV